jgi:hypothetical protein
MYLGDEEGFSVPRSQGRYGVNGDVDVWTEGAVGEDGATEYEGYGDRGENYGKSTVDERREIEEFNEERLRKRLGLDERGTQVGDAKKLNIDDMARILTDIRDRLNLDGTLTLERVDALLEYEGIRLKIKSLEILKLLRSELVCDNGGDDDAASCEDVERIEALGSVGMNTLGENGVEDMLLSVNVLVSGSFVEPVYVTEEVSVGKCGSDGLGDKAGESWDILLDDGWSISR